MTKSAYWLTGPVCVCLVVSGGVYLVWSGLVSPLLFIWPPHTPQPLLHFSNFHVVLTTLLLPKSILHRIFKSSTCCAGYTVATCSCPFPRALPAQTGSLNLGRPDEQLQPSRLRLELQSCSPLTTAPVLNHRRVLAYHTTDQRLANILDLDLEHTSI